MTAITLFIFMLLNDASHNFGLEAGIDYDPIECIWLWQSQHNTTDSKDH